ncbi:transposase, partial [Endozoicomonas ascidiicola]|uniref:transposase n=1 Tax=Endozoicomonas ascidiicola TaxID=1698521 RepID=UPI001C12C07A
MHDRFVLLKRNHELNDEQAFLLDGWCKNYPELGLAYQQKEAAIPADSLLMLKLIGNSNRHLFRTNEVTLTNE